MWWKQVFKFYAGDATPMCTQDIWIWILVLGVTALVWRITWWAQKLDNRVRELEIKMALLFEHRLEEIKHLQKTKDRTGSS
jgi:hypothetical protein